MRTHVPLVSVAVISGLSMLACGSGPIDSYRGKASWSPQVPNPSVLQRVYTAPPDRSLHPVTVAVKADSASAAAEQVRKDLEALQGAVSDDEACEVHLRGYGPPSQTDDAEWASSVQLVLDVALADASDAMARMGRIEACRGLLLPQATYGMHDVAKGVEHNVTIHEGILEIDAPEEHLQALLERRARTLRAAADIPDAPQLHPEDYRCVPTGHVGLGARTLEGVVLTLDLDCRVDGAVAPAPEG